MIQLDASDLLAGLDEFQEKAEEGADKAALAMAEEVAKEARLRAPVDTGELRDSIEARPNGKGQAVVVAGASGPSQDYAAIVHSRQPFMREALMNVRAAHAAAVKVYQEEVFQ